MTVTDLRKATPTSHLFFRTTDCSIIYDLLDDVKEDFGGETLDPRSRELTSIRWFSEVSRFFAMGSLRMSSRCYLLKQLSIWYNTGAVSDQVPSTSFWFLSRRARTSSSTTWSICAYSRRSSPSLGEWVIALYTPRHSMRNVWDG